MNTLVIFFTYQCNYKCPYCILNTDKINIPDNCFVWSNESKSKCFQHISDNNIKNIIIMGGEPLLYPNEVIDIVEFCNINNIKLSITSNGSLLTPQLVNYFNKNKIYLLLSISCFGYKNIELLLNNSNKDIIKLIKSLHNKSIRIVYDKNYSLSTDVTILHELFNCTVEVSCDFTEMKSVDHKELDYIENEIAKLEQYHTDISWFSLVPFNKNYTYTTDTIHPNGKIIKGPDKENAFISFYENTRLFTNMNIDILNRYICMGKYLAYNDTYTRTKLDKKCNL